jgi:integrase
MTKTARNKLTDVEIRKAARPFARALSDGGNLYVDEMPNTGVLKWRVTFWLGGRKATIWIGAYPKLSLRDARKRRDEIEDQAGKGIDPKVARKVGPLATGMTFKQFVEAHGADLAPAAPRGRREWIAAMTGRVGKLADMQPGAITGDDIAEALKPVWVTKPATAKKRLQGIATVLRAARARGLIATPGWTNPADYRHSFSGVMKKPVVQETPREAMPYADLPGFIRDLRAQPGPLALGLEMIVLSAVRASEGLGARWCEIDREACTWTVPAERMKGITGQKREHVVPLSSAMLDVLERAMPKRGPAPKGSDYIFPSYRHAAGCFDPGSALDLLRDLRPGTLTVHGFRSAFFDWSQEASDYSDRLANASLAHAVKDRVQRAYDRSALLERRRPLMADWGDFCASLCVSVANADGPEPLAEAA